MKIAVFCSSQMGNDPTYSEIAFSLGKEIASRGHTLIYGGVNRGLMERVASGALTGGGQVVGYYSKFLENCPDASSDGIEIVLVDTAEERRKKMFEGSDACIVFPGGFGTLGEIAEILIMKQMGKYGKPIAIFNLNFFYDDFEKLLKKMVAENFIEPNMLDDIIIRESMADLLEGLGA